MRRLLSSRSGGAAGVGDDLPIHLEVDVVSGQLSVDYTIL
jgi:hypothetical protein